MTIKTLAQPEAFREVESSWEDLLAEAACDTLFLTQPYLATWWKHFGAGSELLVLLVEEADRLNGALPLAIRSARIAGQHLRVAEILGTGPAPTRPMGLSDRTGLPIRQGVDSAPAELARALAERKSDWDLLHLKGLLPELEGVEPFLSAMTEAGFSVVRMPRYESPYLALEGSFEEYRMKRSKNFRKQLKKDWRELREQAPAEVEKGEEVLSAEEILDSAFDIMDKSWKSKRGSGLFQDRALRAFFTDLLADLLERGWLMPRFIRQGDRRIAHEICFRYHGRVYSYNSCFDADFARFSPGELLTAAVLEEAWDAGMTEYDMLRGDESYKLRWSTTTRQESEILVMPPGLKSQLYRFYHFQLKSFVRNRPWLSEVDNKVSGLFHNLFTHK